ncbi:MAG: CoA transferase [Hyphomicrobiales bacterium]|nr:CoA transferase [Hyphomicrobiales bacterium]
MSDTPQALAGVKVVEFGAYAAGPHIGKLLGNFGAVVAHVESFQRPDGFRLQYPPYKDGVVGVNRSGCFSIFNDSKYGVTVDVKNPAGLEIARRLMDWADVVIENMRPGVMDRIGLGYAVACRTNPGLVMLSTCNMGQTGPRAQTPGFGTQLSSLAGFCGAIGEPDGSPMLLYGPYIDFVASMMGSSAVLAALARRRATGKGTLIDLSQYETGLHFMAGALLAYHRDGVIAERRGNRDDKAAPHGAYRCREDRWLALSCWSDAEFSALAETLGKPALAADARFAGAEERLKNVKALDAALAPLLRERDAEAAAETLQGAGIAAYPVNSMADLFTDPQLVERRLWRRREHAEIGQQSYEMPGFALTATPGDVTRAAPILGGDNETVFKRFLGLSDAEYAAYAEKGAFD